MAKKKKKGAGAKDVDDLSKSALKAYHKDICAFYLDNGWRETLSNFSLSPKQASSIIPKKFRTKRKELEKESKKKAPKKKKGAKKAPKKPGKKKAEKPEKAEKAPKKLGRPAKKKAGKRKPGRPRKTAVGKKGPDMPSDIEGALDFLLSYRRDFGKGCTLDEAIIELTGQLRATA